MNQINWISVAEAFEPDERRKREENGYFPRHQFSFRRIQREGLAEAGKGRRPIRTNVIIRTRQKEVLSIRVEIELATRWYHKIDLKYRKVFSHVRHKLIKSPLTYKTVISL